MIRLILILAILLALFIVFRQLQNTPPEKRKGLYLKAGISITAGIVLLLALTGRVHWIGGLIAALVPFARAALPYVIKYFPVLQQYRNQQQQQQNQQAPQHQHRVDLTVDEAYQVLGLEPGADKEAIIKSHRQLIQKNHPDRGGNDYLAAQINQAKEVLIKQLG